MRSHALHARIASIALASAMLSLLAGCASTIFISSQAPGDIAPVDEPRFEARTLDAPQRVALVLSGGATRAFAHLGVLRVLEREGLRPDLVVGSSAGAIVGAHYAAGKPVAEIEALAARLNLPTLIDIDPVKTLLGGFGGLGLAKGQRLEAFLRESIGAPLQSLPIRFAAVATDLNNGETLLLNHGDTARALRASSAMPGLYEPVHAGGRVLGDGQIASPLPTGAARLLGARVVVGVDVVYPPQHATLTSAMSVLFQTMTISTYRHLQRERELADLVITPEIPSTSDLALSDREWLIAAGEAAAEKALPALRAAFRKPQAPGP
ncbi:MAG: patatin-like phospholipase family protein [Burkholderiaceae bacterium]|nr:patatin-like phospholipase family protein [Burkholderiaceae bacterium]